MILQVFSVRDTKAEAYAPPFFLPRVEVAIRTFNDAIRDRSHPMSAHPEDYELFVIGEFDDSTGLITSNEAPALCAKGSDHGTR